MAGTDPAAPPRTAPGKLLAVLCSFEGEQLSRGVSELASELAMPKATVHRLLCSLTEWGLVERLPDGRYAAALRLFSLGAMAQHRLRLRQVAQPHLHWLYERTGSTVYLSVMDGDAILHLEHIPAPGRRVASRLGARWSVHCSSLGKVILAHSSPDEIEAYLARTLERRTPKTITDPDVLRDHLAEVRRLGYGTTIEESILGVYGLAAGVFDRGRRIVAAVCIAGYDRRLLALHTVVKDAAHRITADLAHSYG